MSTHTMNTEQHALDINLLRSQLENQDYMNQAIDRLAWELSLELMEKDYGLHVHDQGNGAS